MKYSKKYFLELCLLIFVFIYLTQITKAQLVNEKIDSFKVLIKNSKNIIEQINFINQISSLYNRTNPDSALFYSDIAINKAKKNNAKILFASIYNQRGVIFKNKGIIDSAGYYLYKALYIYEYNKDIVNIIQCNIAIGEFYRSTNTLLKASNYIKKAIHLSKDNHIYTFLPYAYNRLGAVVFELACEDLKENPIITPSYLIKAIEYVDTSFLWSKKKQ